MWLIENLDKIPIIVILFLIPNFLHVLKNSNRKSLLKELTDNKMWVINFIIILLFTGVIYYLNKKIENRKDNNEEDKILIKKHLEAIKKAILALVIALLVHFRLTIAPFWFVFFLAYYFEGWV
tara:strand:+ start:4217 stop:4585 length:369 start_codon:yes stop_codon:yes gene_type:complete